MKYILALFAVFLLLECSDARPNRKGGRAPSQNAHLEEVCQGQLSAWFSMDLEGHDPTHYSAALKCLCDGVQSGVSDVETLCKTKISTFLDTVAQSRQQQDRKRRSKSSRSSTTTEEEEEDNTIVEACGEDPDLIMIVAQFGLDILDIVTNAGCSGSDVECIVETILQALIDMGDQIDCLIAIREKIAALG